MRIHTRLATTICAIVLILTGANATTLAQDSSPVEEIRKQLLKLPYYGVFDFLAFSYDKGTVTLMGYAYSPNLKNSAERAVKRAPKVDQVINNIEELPVSMNDDELRWKLYYNIYGDPFLSRYAPGGGMLWGMRSAYHGPFSPMNGGPFLAYEAAGDYPIHIIVKNGRVTLLGIVDSESDKTVAGMRAREVPGSFNVENELVVRKQTESVKR